MFDNIFGKLNMPVGSPYAKLENNKDFVTGETRALYTPFADPTTLNFKLLIHFESNHGLFADHGVNSETYSKTSNSAISYLYRIGENQRAEALNIWITNFKELIKYYDFLFLQVEGLETIMNFKPENVFTDEEKINFVLRETSDLFVQSLITNYRNIVYDNVRGVEVLPSNLRKFDAKVLVYTSGYFNTLYYDIDTTTNPTTLPVDKLVMPTKGKLDIIDKIGFKVTQKDTHFNHLVFNIEGLSFNIEDTGKGFTSNIINEQNSEFVKNNFTFNFKRANYSGSFNNISGNVDIGEVLCKLAVLDSIGKYAAYNVMPGEEETINQTFRETINQTWAEMKNAGLDIWRDTKNKIINRYTIDFLKDKIFSNVTFLGDMLGKFSVDYAKQLIQNTIDYGLNGLENVLINDPLNQVNNFISLNYGDNIYSIINNNSNNVNNEVGLIENQNVNDIPINGTSYTPSPNADNGPNIRLGGGNVYTGESW